MLLWRISFFTVKQSDFHSAHLQKCVLERQAMLLNPIRKRQQYLLLGVVMVDYFPL